MSNQWQIALNDIMNQLTTSTNGYSFDKLRMVSKVEPLLKVSNLKVYYPIKRGLLRRTAGFIKAVDGISFGIRAGQTLGLVGESGCGKTTVARSIARSFDPSRASGPNGKLRMVSKVEPLAPAMTGEVVFGGIDVLSANKDELRQIRPSRASGPNGRQVSIIFQDPYSSLNPRMTVGEIIGEPLKVQSHWGHQVVGDRNDNDREDIRLSSVEARVAVLLSKVGLSPECMNRYPHEFSAGQRQRIGIARALVLKPRLVICDEPVSSLDVSIQSQILNLLKDLQEEFALTYLFIAHDMAVVEFFCDIVAVMYMGKIVEQAEAEELYRNPLHPYTRELMSAIPQVEPAFRGRKTPLSVGRLTPQDALRRAGGEAPSILSPPPPFSPSRDCGGCPFHTRCPLAEGDCLMEMPILEEKSKGHFVACWKCKKIDY